MEEKSNGVKLKRLILKLLMAFSGNKGVFFLAKSWREVVSDNNEKIGWYGCALIDLLGQQLELKKLSKFDEKSISEHEKEINSVFQKTYGRVKIFKKLSNDSVIFFNSEMRAKISNLKLFEFSDLITLNVSLSEVDGTGKFNIKGVYFLLLTTAYTFFHMLSKGIPLRGGVEVGLGIATDNCIYGQSLSKAYALESTKARSIRVVVGELLVGFVEEAKSDALLFSGEDQEYIRLIDELICRDSDSVYILNYLKKFGSLDSFRPVYDKAKAFLEQEEKQFCGDEKMKEKYSKALEYFRENPPLATSR